VNNKEVGTAPWIGRATRFATRTTGVGGDCDVL